MTTFVTRDGSRLTPYMFWQIERLNAEVKQLFGVEIKVSSGIRLHQEQIDIFLKRYVVASQIAGRPVYDTRVWRGVRYYRISKEGTVAPPGESNHEIQGTKAAVDIRDTGADPGVTAKNSVRGRWIRANAHRFGMVASGDGFNEGWHFDVLNIFNAVPGGGGNTSKPTPAVPKPEEDEEDVSHAVGAYIGGDKNTPANQRTCVIYYPDSGFYTTFSGVDQAYINDQARMHRCQTFGNITPKHWTDTIKPQLDKLLAK